MGKRTSSNHRTVCLLSNHPLVLEELRQYLSDRDHHLKVQRLELALANKRQRIPLPRAAVYVVDANIPRPATELVIDAILNRFPMARVVALIEKLNEVTAFPLLRLGVKGLLINSEAHKLLAQVVDAVIADGFWVPRALLSRFMDSMASRNGFRRRSTTPAGLSCRELEILDALLERQSNKEIGGRLNISVSTVKFHLSNLFAKFGVTRRTDLILLFWQNPLLTH